MIYYTKECRKCGLPCLHNACPYYKVKHFKCDYCGEVDIKLYNYNGDEICEDCLLDEFDVIDNDEWI